MKNEEAIRKELLEYMEDMPVINTHCHHCDDTFYRDMSVCKLMKNSYFAYASNNFPFEDTIQDRKSLFQKYSTNTYFKCLNLGISRIYGNCNKLDIDNWDEFDRKIQKAYKDETWHIKILKSKCNYEEIILDNFKDLAGNNGHPDVFTTAVRCDALIVGRHKEKKDHDGNTRRMYFNNEVNSISQYVEEIEKYIVDKLANGARTIKIAIGYERPLNFDCFSREEAEKALNVKNPSKAQVKAFEDYVTFSILKIADQYKLPVQFHTGLGGLKGTSPLCLQNLIELFPNVKFIMLHCGFPWVEDMYALLHNYRNVYPDITWLPMLSPDYAGRAIKTLLHLGNSGQIGWGCDTPTSEESQGSLIMLKNVLADVVLDFIKDDYFNISYGRKLIDNILLNNPKQIYNFT